MDDVRHYARDMKALVIYKSSEMKEALSQPLEKYFGTLDLSNTLEQAYERVRAKSYNFIFIEGGHDEDFELEFISGSSGLSIKPSIFFFSKNYNSDYLLKLVDIGIVHFFVFPISVKKVVDGLENEIHVIKFREIEKDYEKTLEGAVLELESRKEELELINKVISEGAKAEDAETLLAELTNIVVEGMHFSGASAYVLNNEFEMVAAAAENGIALDVKHGLRSEPISETPLDGVSYSDDYFLETEIAENYPEFFERFNIHSLYMFPIKTRIGIQGRVYIFNQEQRELSVLEISLLLTVMQETGIYISKVLADENLREYMRQIKRDLRRKIESLKKAQAVQQTLNTSVFPSMPNLSISAVYMPSEELGGDFFDIRRFGDTITVILTDCVGHGIEASMDATLAKSIVDRYLDLLADKKPDEFLSKVNEEASQYFKGGNFPTMFACSIDCKTEEIVYANANSPIPFIISEGDVFSIEKPKGFHLGFGLETKYEKKSIKLKEDQIFLMYSDALVEISYANDLVEVDKIKSILSGFGKGVDQDLNHLLNSISKFKPLPLEDDTTLILIERVKAESVDFETRTHVEIDDILTEINAILAHYNYGEHTAISAVRVVLREILGNSISHGHKGDTSKSIRIKAHIDGESASFTIEDEGAGFDYKKYLAKAKKISASAYLEGDYSKLGIWLCLQCVDELEYYNNGRSVYIKISKPPVTTRFMTFDDGLLVDDDEKAVKEGAVVWDNAIDAKTLFSLAKDELNIDFRKNAVIPTREMHTLINIVALCINSGKKLKLHTSSSILRKLFYDFKLHEVSAVSVLSV